MASALTFIACAVSAAAQSLPAGLALEVLARPVAAKFLVGEPLAVDVALVNGEPEAISAPQRLSAAGVSLLVSRDGGPMQRIRALDVEAQLRELPEMASIAPGLRVHQRLVFDVHPVSLTPYLAEPGVYRVRVEVDPGYMSELFRIDVRRPAGRDIAALDALAAMRAEIDALPFDTVADRMNRILASEAAMEAYLDRFGGSTYGGYVRLDLAESLATDYAGLRDGDLDGAAALLESAAADEAFPLRDQALLELSNLQRSRGETAAADRSIARLRELSPSSPLATDRLLQRLR